MTTSSPQPTPTVTVSDIIPTALRPPDFRRRSPAVAAADGTLRDAAAAFGVVGPVAVVVARRRRPDAVVALPAAGVEAPGTLAFRPISVTRATDSDLKRASSAPSGSRVPCSSNEGD